jgi:hydrogenase expression/formation protein HypC
MCLGVPGKIVEVHEDQGLRMGTVDFGGIRRVACLEYAPEVAVGSFVVIHVGFAISVVDEEEAARSYALLAAMGNLEGIDLPVRPDGVRPEEVPRP